MSWVPRQKVVVPIDFSEDSFAAIAAAIDLVGERSHVHLVHVLPEIVPLDPADVQIQSLDDEARVGSTLEAMRQQLTRADYAELPCAVVIGNPGHAIARYAAEQHADLIVMPSHGRTGLARMLIGSVTERVIRLAHCPVLVLRK